MLTEGREAELLEKAKVEEKAYNWAEAAKLYEQLAEFFLDRRMVKEAAETYKKLGYTNIRAAETSSNEEKYIEFSNKAITAYKEAAKIFKQMEKIAEVSECEAEVLYASGIISGSDIEAKKAWSNALELFNTSYESYSNKNDDDSCARVLSRVLMILSYLGWNCIDSKEFQQIFQKGGTIAKKAWKISKDIGNIQYLAESLYAEVSIKLIETFFINIKANENWKKNFEEIGLRCNEILTLGENCNDLRIHAMIYSAIGEWYLLMGYNFIDDEIEQREYFIKGVRFLEKSIECARKTNDKAMILHTIITIDLYAYASPGMQSYLTKRVYNDLQAFKRYIKRFASLINPSNMLAKFFLVGAYGRLAITDFLSHKQRLFFAMEAIKYSKKFLKDLPSAFLAFWINFTLTQMYSALTNLAASREKQVEYADKALFYAKQAEDLAKNYEKGGFLALNSLDGSFLAYKTLADIAESDDKKIKMLNLAIDAIEKKLKLNIDSRFYIFEDQIRQATLYEELGVLTKSTDTLKEASELFSGVIKRSLKWGYYFFGAIACDYIARIEDRLGNYNTSAENYEKAQEVYSKMLKIFTGYKRGTNFVKEKILYVRAWNLIEKAKAYHKRENHIKAKECYIKASEILNEVSRYNYEAPYYAAWSLLEEAERISKQDRQDDAIERYKTTRIAFEQTIEILANESKESKEKSEGEKVEKLKKVARLRMNYCSARIDLEKARILGKQGEHLEAAEKFASAASQFRSVCTRYKIERERKELEAVYYLCRAWESMELAEKYEEPDRFAEAANLFTEASNLFTDSKLKLLSSGNSTFCQALEYGCKFDDSIEMETKSQLYPKVKTMLRKAADLYRKGGFESGADWSLATSTYFDAGWHLIKADGELDINEKRKLLGIGARYLKSAAELFSTAGHKDKVIDVQEQLKMVEREEIIILSALNTVKRPAVSSSTMGILAPACPIETSQPPKMSEIQQIEESRSVLGKKLGASLDIYECDTSLNILHISDIQEGRFGIKEDISEVSEAYINFLSDLKDKLEIIHRKNKIDIIVISGDLTSIGSEEEFNHLTNEFLPILNEVFLNGPNIVPKNRWIIIPGNHDVEWDKGDARFNNFIQFCQENGFHQYKLNNPESIYSRIICRDKSTGNTVGIIALNSCLDIFDENSPNISNISNSYFSSFSKDWDTPFRKIPKLMVCHHTLHSIKKDRFNNALNKLSDNNVLLALAGDIHKSESHADEISNIRCIPAGTILAKKTERQVGIDEVSRQFNLVNINLLNGYVKWYTYSFEGNWREIKNESFYLEHPSFSKQI